jgi:polyisoprenoid-binding protein YceI
VTTFKTMLKFAVPAALAFAAAPMIAQMPMEAPGKMDKSRVVAGTYTADANHTLIGWRVNHLGFNDYFGLFGSITGTLTLDPAKPADAKVSMTIPVSKILTANAGLNAHLLKPAAPGAKAEFFGANPADATFVSTGVVPGADGTSATINGDLTLNGVTKPVSIAATFTGAGNGMMSKAVTVGFQGTTTIKRSEFGVAYGIPMVSDTVKLDISVAFEKKPA